MVIKPDSLNNIYENTQKAVSLSGRFLSDDASSGLFQDLAGTFTFTNATETGLHAGHILCHRPEGLPWYRSAITPWTHIVLVPIFSLLVSMSNMQPVRDKQTIVMTIISCLGWLCNVVANRYIFQRVSHPHVESLISDFSRAISSLRLALLSLAF